MLKRQQEILGNQMHYFQAVSSMYGWGEEKKKNCTVNASDISRITINQTEKNEQAVITLRHLRLISIFKKN